MPRPARIVSKPKPKSPTRAESPFARYRGIGNPGIAPGRKAILKYLRAMRGE